MALCLAFFVITNLSLFVVMFVLGRKISTKAKGDALKVNKNDILDDVVVMDYHDTDDPADARESNRSESHQDMEASNGGSQLIEQFYQRTEFIETYRVSINDQTLDSIESEQDGNKVQMIVSEDNDPSGWLKTGFKSTVN
jgi:hypothetical protein